MIVQPADRLKNVGEYYFSQKLEIIRQMRAAGHDVINLGIGSPDLAPSANALEATAQALKSEKNHGYAPYKSLPELRRAMSDWYGRAYGVKLNPDTEVLPLLGSKEGILYTSMAFLNPGDTVLVPNPGYPAYSSVSALLGLNVIHYDLTEENGWLPDFKALEKYDLSRCKLMWANYPHMPTGRTGNAELFEKLVDFGRRKKILICNDNPYSLVLNRDKPLSILSFDPSREVAIELNSLSKSFNMAGWRVGMAMGGKDAINAILQVKSNVDSGMFAPIQAGAAEALKNPDSWHDERNAIYRERREAVWKIFDRLGFSYDKNQVGLFVWAKAPDKVKDVGAYVDEVLEKTHVFLTPGFIFGSNGKRYARSSLCAPAATLNEALKRVGSFA
jgi:aspartate/methionine/tyrosine aminotransferase